MAEKDFFAKINFNKAWSEEDWERYFQAHDAYRLSLKNLEIRKKPAARIRFEGTDEVKAFEPVLRAYGLETTPGVVRQIQSLPFAGDDNPDDEYTPATTEDPHFWGEGAPLASLPIYRDGCRFAIYLAKEVERFLKRRGEAFRKTHSADFESLRFHANWIAINIAQGHNIGYSRERILGNIAKCRRAVRHADDCLAILNRISRYTRSSRLRHELFSFTVQIRHVLYMWIDEMRARFD